MKEVQTVGHSRLFVGSILKVGFGTLAQSYSTADTTLSEIHSHYSIAQIPQEFFHFVLIKISEVGRIGYLLQSTIRTITVFSTQGY